MIDGSFQASCAFQNLEVLQLSGTLVGNYVVLIASRFWGDTMIYDDLILGLEIAKWFMKCCLSGMHIQSTMMRSSTRIRSSPDPLVCQQAGRNVLIDLLRSFLVDVDFPSRWMVSRGNPLKNSL